MAFKNQLESGIKKLRDERESLINLKTGLHYCDCEFCERKGDEVTMKNTQQRLTEVNEELQRLERYKGFY